MFSPKMLKINKNLPFNIDYQNPSPIPVFEIGWNGQ